MALGFLTRPRSRKRMLLISLTALVLWRLSPSPSTFSDTSTSTTGVVDYLLTRRPPIYSQMLDHHQKPLCPRFSKYDRQKLLLLEPTECTPVETEHPDFSADICFSPFVCNEGLVRVRRRDRQQCKEANLKYPISGNSTHDAFHRQFSGPDSFHVVFSGSEKLSPPDWYHAGQCLYIFPFHISNPGRLSLDITHLYDNFGAVVEQAKEWPVLWRKRVISGLPLEVCRGCPSRVARPRFSSLSEVDEMVALKTEGGSDGAETAAGSEKAGGSQVGTLPNMDRSSLLALGMSSGSSLRNRYQAYTNSRTGPQKYSNLFMNENYDRLPLCSRDHAVQGAWLPAHPLDKRSWRQANYTWTPLGCRFEKPLDKTCLVNGKKGVNKILFQGDTHLRVAMEELLRRLNGSTTLETNPPSSPSPDRLEEKHASTTFSYLHDPLFSHTNENADMLVANMGHWATGTKFFDQLMSTSKYHDKLRDLVETIQQRARDIQEMQDEDDELLGHFLDDEVGGYGGEADDEDGHDYGFVDEGDEDEEELEKERGELRQEELAMESSEELTDEEVYWEDETEEEVDNRRQGQEVTKQQHRRPTVQELEDQQEAMDDIEDKYRVDDRQRAESEGYISRNQNNKNRDPVDRTRARYPSNHILRQSKHVKTPAKPKIDDESEVEEEEEIEEEQKRPVVAQNRYRYGAQKKVMLGDNGRLIKSGEGDDVENVKIPSTKKTIGSNNKKTTTSAKSRPASINTPAGKKTTIATKRPASPAFRSPNAYGARKTVPVTTTSKSSSYAASGNRKKTTADTKKVSSSSSSSNKTKKRAFLDDDYPSLTSPLSNTSSTPSSTSSSSSSSPISDRDSLMKMAWVGVLAYPETQQPVDSFVSHDWRTIYRLRYWNLIAEDVMTLHNVRFMDFFSMTLSMLDTSPDRAHYYGTDAAEAMLEELAFKLDLCEDKE